MSKPHVKPDSCKQRDNKDNSSQVKKSLSMHADIPVWYDCCSCEAEPYWLEAMGIDPNDDDKDAG